MITFKKHFSNIEKAENYMFRLYDIYSYVKCVSIPTNNNGYYFFQVKY